MSTAPLATTALTLPSGADLEQAIVALGEGMRALGKSRLRRDTIILLLHDRCKIGKRDIGYVLNALESLEQVYLKPVLTPKAK